MPLTRQKRFSQYVPNKQACLIEAEADYGYKQVELGREINPVKIHHKTVCSISCKSMKSLGWVIIKFLVKTSLAIVTGKVKFQSNIAVLDLTNSFPIFFIFSFDKYLDIVDLRSIGYYKINHSALKQNLNKHYRFELAESLHEEFNKLINQPQERNTRFIWSISMARHKWWKKEYVR